MVRLAVIVITHNESGNIRQCLESVKFADRVHVLDSGSTDGTVEIAREMGAIVEVSDNWPGFGIQKNRVLDLAVHAGCEWVLSLDADERVSSGLQEEIKSVLALPLFDVYALSRLSSYCGKTIYHSGWYPDRVVRLFRHNAARFSNNIVHEKILTTYKVGNLHHPLFHDSFKNLESVLDKTNRYSTAGAKILYAKGKTPSLGIAIAHGIWAFIRTYFLRRGFLDGKMGFILAVSNAEGTYYRYLKCWLMQQNNY